MTTLRVLSLLACSLALSTRAADPPAAPGTRPPARTPAEEENEERAVIGRIQWLREGRLGPDGRFPADARIRAYAQVKENLDKGLLGEMAGAIPGSRWVELGPSPSSTNSGRVSAIAVHPTDPNTVYVGTASGGVWKTTNAGANWTPLTDQQASLATGSIALAPSDPNTIYVGTGEPNNSCDSYFGAGVLRSTDAGANWTLVGNSRFSGHSISRVVVHPSNPQALWVSVTGGVQGSFLCAGQGTSNTGIWQSADGGVNWTRGTNGSGSADRVIIDPANPAILYGAFSGSGIRKSTDGGATWTQLAGGLPAAANIRRSDVAIRAADGNLFAIFENTSSTLQGIYRSTDGGTTWTPTAATPPSGTLCQSFCWYFIGVEAAPDGAIWARGFYQYRSTDSGATWTSVNGGMHVDQHAAAFASNGDVWAGNDGGVYRCVKSATNCVTAWSWTHRNTGLGAMQFYPGASLHPSNTNILLGGMQDNGSTQYNGASWTQVYGWDGAWTAIDQATPTTEYVGHQNLYVYKSTNSGGSFADAVTGLTDAYSSAAPFIAPFVLCPNNSAIMIAGSDNVWKTVNATAPAASISWASASPDPLHSGRKLNAMEFAKSDATCNTFFVGSTGGQMWRTTVGGGTTAAEWANVSTGLPGRGIQDIAVHPSDGNIVYVGLAGYSANVWKSTNALAASPSWTSVSTGLPSVPVNSVVIDPTDANIVYIGTDTGIFRSNNGGAGWIAYSTGLPKVPVFDLAANATTNTLVAFTHGRGAWRLATQPAGEAGYSSPLRVAKNGANYDFTWGAGTGCSPAEYHLYAGDLTTLRVTGYSHGNALNCAGAATAASVPQSSGAIPAAAYFLVTAGNGGEEGSYGRAYPSGTEIPVSAARCRPSQNIAACP